MQKDTVKAPEQSSAATVQTEQISVLQVEDDVVDRQSVERILTRCAQPVDFAVESVERLSVALQCLANRDYDLALLDLGLPDSRGIEIIQKVREVNPHIPIVVLTGLDDEQTGLLAIKNGATDYLIKGPALGDSLVRALLYALERKKAGDALRESEQKYKTLLRNIPQKIFYKDLNSVYILCNESYAEDLKIKTGEIKGKTDFDFHPRELAEKYRADDKKIMQSGRTKEIEEAYIKDGQEMIIHTLKAPIKDEKNNVIGILGIFWDITERKKAEQKIKEAMEMKSEFISTVSHELRTPLTSMKEGLSIVLDGAAGPINNDQKDLLDIAKRNLERLTRLINDFLDFQKFDSGKMKFNLQQNDINEAVTEVYNMMVSSVKDRHIDLLLELEDNLPKLKFDRDRIIQVLTNLVNNAIKFTEKGKIAIGTGIKENIILVSVSDTGHGIKQESLPRLFHKFEQLEKGGDRKTGGTGLGLAISKEIIEKHNAKIWAESEVGVGTTLYFVLPIVERRAKLRKDS